MTMKNIFSAIKEKHITRRTFDYSKKGVNLTFTLRTDIPDELKIFKDLMIKAIKNIDIELNRPNS